MPEKNNYNLFKTLWQFGNIQNKNPLPQIMEQGISFFEMIIYQRFISNINWYLNHMRNFANQQCC